MPASSFSRPVRVTAGLAMVASAALVLAGCGRADTAGTAAAVTVDDSAATGTVSLWAPDGDAKALKTTLASFEADNPDLDLTITLVPEAEYTTKLSAAIASGTGPDVAQTYTETQAGTLAGGAFAPVPEGLVDSDDFFQGSWDAGVIDDVAYTVPWYTYTYALVYRQDIADAAGVTAPTTWEEMVPFLEGLQSAGAVKGFGADVGWDVYSGQNLTQYVWQAGGDVMNSDGTEWTLDTPEMIAAMEYVKNFFDTGVADIGGPGFLDTQSYFVEGKTAAMITGPWVIGQLDAVAGEDGWTAENVGTVPVPGGAGGNIETIAGGSLGVLTDSDNQENAWKVIRYLAEPDTQVAQYDAYASLPAVQSAW
ncbi:MAG: putative transporter-binding protein, partial [Glaciihabitans sp.]|nr:putative transporter-binding protein [Glaciihabitans sp.]